MSSGENVRQVSAGSQKPSMGSRAGALMVSRQSGLAKGVSSTFGTADRFGKAERSVTVGKHSPWGERYYERTRLYKDSTEIGREPSLGIGDRPNYENGLRNVGPGSYEIVASRAKQRSPLDGPDFCTVTLKSRTKVVVGQKNPSWAAAIPGPGQYEVRPKAGAHAPKYKIGQSVKDLAPLKASAPPPLSRSSSHSSISKASGNKVKSTFGLSERQISANPNSSPAGELYYSHIKIMNKEDYAKQVRACSLGSGQRTDFSFSNHTASPASYGDLTYYTSAAKKTSPIDGFAERGTRAPMVLHNPNAQVSSNGGAGGASRQVSGTTRKSVAG